MSDSRSRARRAPVSLSRIRSKLWLTSDPVRIECFGDSVMYGYQSGGPLDALPGQDASSRRAAKQISGEITNIISTIRTGVTVTNAAVPGSTLATARPASASVADLVIMMFGVNDQNAYDAATFQENYEARVEFEQSRGSDVMLMTLTPQSSSGTDLKAQVFCGVVADVARAYDCALVDSWQQLAPLNWDYFNDGVHIKASAATALGQGAATLLLPAGRDGGPIRAMPGLSYGPRDQFGVPNHGISNLPGSIQVQSINQGEVVQVPLDVRAPCVPVFTSVNTSGSPTFNFQLFETDTVLNCVHVAADGLRHTWTLPALLPGYRVLTIYVPTDGGSAPSITLEKLAFTAP